VASSTNTNKVHCGPRSSNHQCSLPDLHQFANALAPRARLMNPLLPLLAIKPQSVGDHPLPQGLAGEQKAMLATARWRQRCVRRRCGLLGRPRFFEIKPAAPSLRNAFNSRHT
jgi:hypothetical protein